MNSDAQVQLRLLVEAEVHGKIVLLANQTGKSPEELSAELMCLAMKADQKLQLNPSENRGILLEVLIPQRLYSKWKNTNAALAKNESALLYATLRLGLQLFEQAIKNDRGGGGEGSKRRGGGEG